MTAVDWLVIVVLLSGIIMYGLYRSKTTKNLDGYFLSNRNMPWYLVLLGIMGTQASAITFLSAPGQAYADGMRFVQYYFGLPLAIVVICITFVPIFNRLRVYTAYEFLENRFDKKTRVLTSALFLLQRGLSTGVSIYAPSIILSSLFGWDIYWTNMFMGGLLIIYTVSGGARAVAHTQKLQLIVIFIAMSLAAYFVIRLLPAHVSVSNALTVSGKLGKMNVITSGVGDKGFDWKDRYNIWSGLIGGFFLALSYFGTDQSQVGRYITAKNNRQSRLGLLLNGLVKVPMQFFILLIGVLVFSFYQFNKAPLTFNDGLYAQMKQSPYRDSVSRMQARYDSLNQLKAEVAQTYTQALHDHPGTAPSVNRLLELNALADSCRAHFRQLVTRTTTDDGNDTNYVFLSFTKHYLPAGLKGLLIAIIFLAAWGSIAAALNSLAASTVVDFHKRMNESKSAAYDFRIARWYTLAWGLFSILIAQFSTHLGRSLIEAVNILGSLFYGVTLGIFLVAFYMKRIHGSPTFYAALIVESVVVLLFFNQQSFHWKWLPELSFLWLNMIGAVGVMALAFIFHLFFQQKVVYEVQPVAEVEN
jgi:solute:Na+ symporter, SSS family